MTLVGNVGRWHGHGSRSELEQSEREPKRTIGRLTQEITDRKALLSAHREHLARIQRQLAARDRTDHG